MTISIDGEITITTAADIKKFLDSQWENNPTIVERVGDQSARVRSPVAKNDLRPGNTVSGPFMMALVDTAMYVAVLAEIGIVPMAVTTSLNINFLRRPTASADVIGECNLLKVGKKLIVGEVSLYSVGDKAPIAHASVTYAVPPPEVR